MRSDDFARATVHDLSSVIRDEIAAIFPKIQLLCEWLQCRHSTTGSEYDTDPQFFLDIEECIAVLFRQLILVIEQGVEYIYDYDFILDCSKICKRELESPAKTGETMERLHRIITDKLCRFRQHIIDFEIKAQVLFQLV